MPSQRHPFHFALLALCLVHLAWFIWQQVGPVSGIAGLLYADGTPVGGDFINLWSAAKLVIEGRFAEIYDYSAFMDYEIAHTGAPIGIRFWAYPPHSLFVVWPFGLIGFYPALFAWTLLGLVTLGWGCRRLGLGRLESLVILISPASVLCVYYGQTGNVATGLLLLALAGGGKREAGPIAAATLLTMKPQMGLLLPFFWAAERRWTAIGLTAATTLSLLGLSWLVFGGATWSAYLGDTLAGLSLLERQGSGPFMYMIPSLFMAMRILTGNGDLALVLHLVLALPILALALWKLWRVEDAMRRAGVVLAATALVTPYLHNYDLTLVAVAGLLVLRRFPPGQRGELPVCILAALALGLPQLVWVLNILGLPIAPLLMLPLLLLA